MKDLVQVSHAEKGFWDTARKIYYIKDSQGKTQVGGYYRSTPDNLFTFLTIPKAGHFVPHT